jgi:HNH endonuclease
MKRIGRPPVDPKKRFFLHVRIEGTCCVWTGAKTPSGYGVFTLNGKYCRAHRASYTLFRGRIPTGLTIDHLCRNKPCVKPSHLEAVSMKVNVLRGVNPAALNSRKTHCPQGHSYDDENTYRWKDGSRHCRACSREKATAIRISRRGS